MSDVLQNLSHGLARLSIHKDNETINPELFIQCLYDCPAAEESSAFIFYSNMKVLDSKVGESVFHVLSGQWRKTESLRCSRPK